jgi:hypothetical protein
LSTVFHCWRQHSFFEALQCSALLSLLLLHGLGLEGERRPLPHHAVPRQAHFPRALSLRQGLHRCRGFRRAPLGSSTRARFGVALGHAALPGLLGGSSAGVGCLVRGGGLCRCVLGHSCREGCLFARL